jgi:hypothetical protein
MTARLRYVVEHKAGLDMSVWSFSRPVRKTSYDLLTNGQGREMLRDILLNGIGQSVLGPNYVNTYLETFPDRLGSNQPPKECELLKEKAVL